MCFILNVINAKYIQLIVGTKKSHFKHKSNEDIPIEMLVNRNCFHYMGITLGVDFFLFFVYWNLNCGWIVSTKGNVLLKWMFSICHAMKSSPSSWSKTNATIIIMCILWCHFLLTQSKWFVCITPNALVCVSAWNKMNKEKLEKMSVRKKSSFKMNANAKKIVHTH